MHRIILAITPNGDYDTLMKPYDENLKEEPYITKTKEEIIKDYRKAFKEAEERAEKGDSRLLNHYSSRYDLAGDDEALFQSIKKAYEEDEMKFDENDNLLCTYNRKALWDYYGLLDHQNGSLITKDGRKKQTTLLKNLDLEKTWENFVIRPNILSKQSGHIKMDEGESRESFKARFMDVLKSFKGNYHVAVLDCHI